MVSFQVVGLPDQISDPFPNPDHLQTNLILTIQNPDISGFQIPTIIRREIQTIAGERHSIAVCALACRSRGPQIESRKGILVKKKKKTIVTKTEPDVRVGKAVAPRS